MKSILKAKLLQTQWLLPETNEHEECEDHKLYVLTASNALETLKKIIGSC